MSPESRPAAVPMSPSDAASLEFRDEMLDGALSFANVAPAAREALCTPAHPFGSVGLALSEFSALSSGLSAPTPLLSYWLVESVLDPPPQPAMPMAATTRAAQSAELPVERSTPGNLLQQPREPPVLQHPALGLAGGAVAHHVVLVEHGLEPVSAPRAGLAVATVDGERHWELVGERELQLACIGVDRTAEHPQDRGPQSVRFVLLEIRSALERGQPGRVEDLVDPRAPDPRDHVLVAQQRVQRPRLVQELEQIRRIRPGVVAELLERILGLRGPDHLDPCSLPGAELAQAQLAALRQPDQPPGAAGAPA